MIPDLLTVLQIIGTVRTPLSSESPAAEPDRRVYLMDRCHLSQFTCPILPGPLKMFVIQRCSTWSQDWFCLDLDQVVPASCLDQPPLPHRAHSGGILCSESPNRTLRIPSMPFSLLYSVIFYS